MRRHISSRMLEDVPAWMTIPMSVGDIEFHQRQLAQGEMTLDMKNCGGKVRSVAFHPKRNLLAIGCEETIRIWDIDERKWYKDSDKIKHIDAVNSVAFIEREDIGSTLLVSGSDDGTAKIWDVDRQACVCTFVEDDSIMVRSVAVCDTNGSLATGSGTEVKIWTVEWDSEKQDCVCVCDTSMQARGQITSVDFYSDEWICAVYNGVYNGIAVWNAQTQKLMRTPESVGNRRATSVAVNRGDGQLVSGYDDGRIEVWSLKASSDCCSGEEDCRFRCVTVADGRVGDNARVTSVAFHSTGMRFAAASIDGTVTIWSPSEAAKEGGWECAAILRGHNTEVTAVSFSMGDGCLLASGSDDETVQLRRADREKCESDAVHQLRERSWAARLAHYLRTEVPGTISADTIGTNVETLYVAAFTFGGLSYTRTLLQAFDCTQNIDKNWYLDAEVTTKCMPSYSTIWPSVTLSVLLTTSCFAGGRSIFRMARGTEFVHISGAREDASEKITFSDAPRVRWPAGCIDLNWVRCVWDIMVWVKYWHSFLSTVAAGLSLIVPWIIVEAVGWLLQRVVAVPLTDKQRNEEGRGAQAVEAAKKKINDVEQELEKKKEAGLHLRSLDYQKAVEAITDAHRLSPHDDELREKLQEAVHNRDERQHIEKAKTAKEKGDNLLRGTTRPDRDSRLTALAYYSQAIILDPKNECAFEAHEDLLADLKATHNVALWFDVVQPVGLSCVHILARFVHGWQKRLEAKGSKERGTWKQSGVKWKLFIVALCALYGALPFYWWQHNVLPDQMNEHEGSGTRINVYQKHERIVLLASIGLTLYGLGLVRYWIELQRQGTGKSTLFAAT